MEFYCEKCQNKRHIFIKGKGWTRCSCVNEVRSIRLMSYSGFPENLWEIKADTFIQDTPNKKKLGEAIQHIVSAYDKKPIYIFSSSILKDKVAAIISRYLSLKHEEISSIKYTDLNDLTEGSFSKDIDISEYYSADILVLSIGKEITNNAHRTTLYNILYSRILSEKFTLLLSSFPKMRVLQIYQKQVDDLIQNNFSFYEC